MKIRRILISLLASSTMLASLPAHAYIGSVGSPVKPSNPPPAAAPDAGSESTADAPPASNSKDSGDHTPILVIRFNQQHVYFDQVLRQAVSASEKAKSGVMYSVVSMVPSGGDNREQIERINATAAANLDAVVQGMQNLGVQSSRIHASTQASPTAPAQEIDIFVQ